VSDGNARCISLAKDFLGTGKQLPVIAFSISHGPTPRLLLKPAIDLARFVHPPSPLEAPSAPRPQSSSKRLLAMSEQIFGIHGAALELRSQRMGVLASNIANAATPGYKARDIDFNAALEARMLRQRGTSTEVSGPALVYRSPTMPALDGNTVELGREQVAFAENALAYSATLSFVQGKVNTITRALKGE
jgi:flagellar basal-body rod protein FlgB